MRRYEVVDGRPRTVAIGDVAVDGPEITLTVDGRAIPEADLEPSDVVDTGDGLTWTLTGAGVTVRMRVQAAGGVVRKRAAISGRGRLERVELDRWDVPALAGPGATGEPVPYNAGPVGLGQPLFGPGFFAGIEHPVAENLVGAGLSLSVAVDLGEEPYVTPAVVVGAGGLEEFWDYVDTLRPLPPRLVTLTNNWYHLGWPGTMDEASVRAEVEGFAAVSARHDLPLDFTTLDDGWDGEWHEQTGIWGRLAPSRFPSGLAALGERMGLWLSPFGGYGERRAARVAWAGRHGWEVDPRATGLCPSGARYRAHLAAALADWTAAGVGYWKLDGLSFTCEEPDHGHPVGPGARTAQVDAFCDLVAAIRRIRPDAVVAFTIGSHPSPWWLSSVDFVWRGGLDDIEAEHSGNRLDRFDTYIDVCLHAYRPAAMPVSALVPFAFVESEAASYRDTTEGWARHCWLAAGRGTLHHDLYLAPDSLSEAEWAVLAEALRWARDHQLVLARSRMVLGDPAAGEVYGFAARRGGGGTVCLRNPSAEPRTVDAGWADLFGFEPTALGTAFGRPPAGAGPLTLDPFEVLVVEAVRVPESVEDVR